MRIIPPAVGYEYDRYALFLNLNGRCQSMNVQCVHCSQSILSVNREICNFKPFLTGTSAHGASTNSSPPPSLITQSNQVDRIMSQQVLFASVGGAMAAARRPHVGCEASSIKLLCAPSDTNEREGPLAAAFGPRFDFQEAFVVGAMTGGRTGTGAGNDALPSPVPMMTSRQEPWAQVVIPSPRKAATAIKNDRGSSPLSSISGRKGGLQAAASTFTLGRLETPPPLVLLAPPPAFDGVPAQSEAPHQQQQHPQRLALTTLMTEDVSLAFCGTNGDVRVSVHGHVQLGITTAAAIGGPAVDEEEPLELELAIADRCGQVAAMQPNEAVLMPNKADEEEEGTNRLPLTNAIPETHKASNSTASCSFRCRIPCNRINASALVLLRYGAKASVRPVPVRVQQSVVRVEAGEPHVAHVVAQVGCSFVVRSYNQVTRE